MADSSHSDTGPQSNISVSAAAVTGGVNLAADQITVGGDFVARDKITVGYTAEQVQSLLARLSAAFQPRPFDGRCPYLGLDAFSEDDADRFFGRETLVSELVARVKDSCFVIIAGPSGSGKSSLVRAGLIHALKQGELPASERWLYVTLTPGRDPIEQLALAMSRLKSPEVGDYLRQHAQDADANALHKCVESVLSDRKDQRVVICVDQFEEVFTQVAKEDERLTFLNLLAHAATVENGRMTALFAMRSDFVSNCAVYPQFNALLNQQFLQVGAMRPDELVSAIARPALQVGLRIDPDLIAQIVNDMRDEPGALPLMQFALRDLFDAQQAKGGVIALTLNDYLARGGLRKSLERHADAAFARLSEDERQLARSIFSGLIEIGRGTQDTRRTALFDEVIPSGVEADRVQAVVQKLADARLITTDERGDKDMLTIAHERLIEAWPWLHRLVNENRDAIALQNQIAEDAKEWDDSHRDASYLYVGARLANAREQLAAKKIILSGLAQAFVESGIASEWAIRQKEEARRQKEIEDARQLAEVQAQRAESEKQRAEEQTRSALKLRQGAVYLIGALVVALGLGVAAGVFGVQSNQTANANATLAAQNAAIASTAQVNAEEAQREASIALGRQLMAQAVTEVDNNPDLGLLLVMEASNVQRRLNMPETLGMESAMLTSLLSGPRPLRFLRGHSKPVLKVAFSPDSKWVASASADGTIRVWDVIQGQMVYTLTGHIGAVNGIDFAAASRQPLLASGGADGTVRLWQWELQDRLPKSTTIAELDSPVHAVVFSPTEMKLAAAGDDKVVRVFDAGSRRVLQSFNGHTGVIYGLAFSHDGTKLASTDSQNDLRVWNVGTGQADNQSNPYPDIYGQEWMHSVTFAPQDLYVITGYGYTVGMVYPTGSGEAQHKDFVEHTSIVRGMAYSHDGTRFATASEDWRIGYCYVSDASGTGCKSVIFLKGHDGPVNSVAFSPDDRWLASGGDDGNVLIWNARFPYAARSLAGPLLQGRRWNIEGLAFGPDSKTLASSNWDGAIRFWDVESGSVLQEFYPNQGTLGVIALSPDGTKVAFGAEYAPHRIWNVDGTVQITLPITTSLNGVAFSPDGKWLATDNDGGKSVCLWAVSDRQSACQSLPTNEVVTRFAFSPDSRTVASNAGQYGQTVVLWDVSVQPPVSRTLGSHNGGIFSFAFSPDGARLASGGADYTVRIWDVKATPSTSVTLQNSGRFARSVAFSPDGRKLVSVNEDWTVRWWDAGTGQPLVTPIKVRTDRKDSVAFSPNGQWLAAGSFDGLIDVWPGNFDGWRATTCTIVNRNLTIGEWNFYVGSNEPYHKTCEQWPAGQ